MSIDCPYNAGMFFDPVKRIYFLKCVNPEGPCLICDVRIIPTEQCAGCPAIKICTRWNSSGTWDYTKGKNPCHLVPKKRFGALDNSDWANGKIVDAEVQRDRFRLRDDK